jgi:HNH endonuclease
MNPCECGCGALAKAGNRFVHGHAGKGTRNHRWSGGRVNNGRGYVLVHAAGHPRENRGGYVFEHILVAEKALGRYLPEGAVLHHVNGDPADNRPENLVICPDQGYHQTLHRRKRALEACGHASWRKCVYCGAYDAPESMVVEPRQFRAYHQECNRLAGVRQRRRKRLAVITNLDAVGDGEETR